MGKKVTIDEDECIGCGSCEEVCREVFKVFKLNEEIGKAEVIKPEGGPFERRYWYSQQFP